MTTITIDRDKILSLPILQRKQEIEKIYNFIEEIEDFIYKQVDVYDALTSKRPYKKAWEHKDAIALIQQEKGKHFDPNLVDNFMEIKKLQN